MVTHTKRGIAMIELIFSIVIMGIVLMSAPLLIQQSISSGHVALQQEAIAAAASQTSVILSMHWDESNSNRPGTSPILDSNRLPFDFTPLVAPLGLANVTGRKSRTVEAATLVATPIANFGKDLTADSDTNESDFTKFDDVDDYDNTDFNLTVFNSEYTTSDIGDYIDVDLNMSIQVNYTEDRVATGDATPLTGDITDPAVTKIALNNNINNTNIGAISNIKFIRVNLTSNSGVAELNKNITFQAFSCNIGTTSTEGRNHP